MTKLLALSTLELNYQELKMSRSFPSLLTVCLLLLAKSPVICGDIPYLSMVNPPTGGMSRVSTSISVGSGTPISSSQQINLVSPNYTTDILSAGSISASGSVAIGSNVDEQATSNLTGLILFDNAISPMHRMDMGSTVCWETYDIEDIPRTEGLCHFLFEMEYVGHCDNASINVSGSILLEDEVIGSLEKIGSDVYLIGDGTYFPLSTLVGSITTTGPVLSPTTSDVSIGYIQDLHNIPLHSRLTLNMSGSILSRKRVGAMGSLDGYSSLLGLDIY